MAISLRLRPAVLAIYLALFCAIAAFADDIDGVQPAALDQPRINLVIRRRPNGPPLMSKTTGGDAFNVEAFLDTGASSITLSANTAQLLGIKREIVGQQEAALPGCRRRRGKRIRRIRTDLSFSRPHGSQCGCRAEGRDRHDVQPDRRAVSRRDRAAGINGFPERPGPGRHGHRGNAGHRGEDSRAGSQGCEFDDGQDSHHRLRCRNRRRREIADSQDQPARQARLRFLQPIHQDFAARRRRRISGPIR